MGRISSLSMYTLDVEHYKSISLCDTPQKCKRDNAENMTTSKGHLQHWAGQKLRQFLHGGRTYSLDQAQDF